MDLTLLAFILLPVTAVSYKVDLPPNVLFKMGDRRQLTCSVRSCPEEVKFSWTSLEDKPLFATVENKHTESLLIFENVMKNTENTVVCKATCGKQSKQATTKIKVYSFQRNPVISGNDHMILGEEGVLTCEVSHVNPSEFLEVELLYEDEVLVSKEGEDGTDSLKISHTFKPSSEDDGKAITCRASLNAEGIPPDERTKETSGHLRVLSAPRIVRVSGLTAVSLGSSLTLTCEAEGSPEPEFTWTTLKPDGQSVKVGEHREIFIRNVTLSDAGVYQCEISNNLGKQTERVSVVVHAFPRNPVITGNDHMILGEENVLTCEVSQVNPSEFLEVELLYEDKILVSKEGEAGTDSLKISHTFKPSSEDDGKAITCRASLNVEGIPPGERTKETSGHLTVLSAPHNVRVSGLTAVSLGSSLTLTCEAEGSPELEFTWTALKPDGQSFQIEEHREISIRNVTLSDAGVYQCEVSNNLGRKTDSVSVVVQAPPMNTIIEASQQTVLKEGGSISIFCKSGGVPVDRVVLRRMVDSRTTELESSVGSETSFSFESVKLSDTGFYQCTAFNKFGSQSASLNLTVEAYLLEVELHPSGAIVAESGSNLTLSCQASGCPQPMFSWKSLGNQPNRGLSKADGFLSQLFLGPVAVEDEGTYICEVTCGSVAKSKQTKVNVFSFPTSPVVESPGPSLEGEMIHLTCTVLDVFPANFFRIVWTDGERELSSESGLFLSHLQNLTSVLSYRVEAKDQDNLMTCKVLLDMNGVPAAQTVKTASTALSIHYPPRGTRITVIPQGELKEGESVSISCLSDSVPVGRVVLIRVVDGIEKELIASDGVETSVILTSLELDDSGLYVCKASNRHGNESDSVEIKVKAPPRNTTVEVFPSSEVQEGQNITICCNSVSFPPPAVVLRKLDSETVIYSPDGVFQLINLTANDTGLYQVNVTNDLGYETEIFTIHVMEKRFESPPSWTDFVTPAICLGTTAALLGIMVHLWRDRKKGSYDLTKCNPDTV